jgi:tetratricopeptide (TPR) repeat protein
MAFPGTNSILDRPAIVTWPDEAARPDVAALIDSASRKIEFGQFEQAATLLDEVERLDPTGSYDMRRRFVCGAVFAGLDDSNQAVNFLTQAQGIATDANDFDSFIVITLKIGEVIHNALEYRSALEYYEIAHSAFETKYGKHPEQNVPLNLVLLSFLGRQLWTIGQLEEAHGKLAAVMTLWHEMNSGAKTKELNPFVSNTLWQLGLTLRAQSDMRDGDAGYIRRALRHMRDADNLKRECGDADYKIGRLYIQTAELYLDLAELNAQRNSHSAARSNRNEAKNFAKTALDYIAPTEDIHGKLMARFALLRCDITARSQQSLIRNSKRIEATFQQLEHESAPLKDRGLIAKIATLRAEWYLSLGDTVTARALLNFALEGFEVAAPGQSTRAERLLRIIDDMASS